MNLSTLRLIAIGSQAKAPCNHRRRVRVGTNVRDEPVWWCSNCGGIGDGYGWRIPRRVWMARSGERLKAAGARGKRGRRG